MKLFKKFKCFKISNFYKFSFYVLVLFYPIRKINAYPLDNEISFDSKNTVNILPNSTDSILPTNQVFDENSGESFRYVTVEKVAKLLNLDLSIHAKDNYAEFNRPVNNSEVLNYGKAAQSYFNENKFVNSQFTVHFTTPIYLGKQCEETQRSTLNPNIPEFNSNLTTPLPFLYETAEISLHPFSVPLPNDVSSPFLKVNFNKLSISPWSKIEALDVFDFEILPPSDLIHPILFPHALTQFSFTDEFIDYTPASLKLQMRDKCVDGVAQFFKFKKWAYKQVQKPVNTFIREKTGEHLLKSPHLSSFSRKYGFEFEPSLDDIKKERIESPVYRWQQYNRVKFYQNSENKFLSSSEIIKEYFNPLPFKFLKSSFEQLAEDLRFISTPIFDPFDLLMPQSYSNLRSSLNESSDLMLMATEFDKKFLEERNAYAYRSLRYYVNYPFINSKIQNDRIYKQGKLPNFLFGPEILKKQGLDLGYTCGYGLGYCKLNSQKIYINPTTGLLSYFMNTSNQLFNGDDQTTYFGVENNIGYYTDKSGIKYFYMGNYLDSADTLPMNFCTMSPDGRPVMRSNSYYHKKGFYYNPFYVKVKEQAGPWKDIRASVRYKLDNLYNIERKLP